MRKQVDETDEQLMARFTETGEPEYFVEIVERHRERIHNYLVSRTRGDHHRAEDLTQEVFMLALQHHDKAKGRSIVAWLLMIATNCYSRPARKPEKWSAGYVETADLLAAWGLLDVWAGQSRRADGPA